jgi:hypothetical protein
MLIENILDLKGRHNSMKTKTIERKRSSFKFYKDFDICNI